MLDARTIIDSAWRNGLRPEPQLLVSEWADQFRIQPATSAEPGPWRTSRVPYLREPMDSLSTGSPMERVVIMKGAQTGGTEVGLNFLGYIMQCPRSGHVGYAQRRHDPPQHPNPD